MTIAGLMRVWLMDCRVRAFVDQANPTKGGEWAPAAEYGSVPSAELTNNKAHVMGDAVRCDLCLDPDGQRAP
jgi:hypothetical protein